MSQRGSGVGFAEAGAATERDSRGRGRGSGRGCGRRDPLVLPQKLSREEPNGADSA